MSGLSGGQWARLMLGSALMVAGFTAAGWAAVLWCAYMGYSMCIIEGDGSVKAGTYMAFTGAPLLIVPGLFVNPGVALAVAIGATPVAFLIAGLVDE